MITDRELKLLRREQEQWMPNSVVVTRPAFVGDNKFVEDTVATDVKCRIHAGFGKWAVVADRYQGITPFTITMPWDTDVQSGDVLIDAYGRTFQIRDVAWPQDYVTAKRLLAELVTDG